MTLQPLGNRAVIEPMPLEEKTASGIVLPDTADKEKPEQGKVVAIGDGEKIKKLGIKEGNKVLFGKYAGTDVKVNEEELKVVEHEDILAIIK